MNPCKLQLKGGKHRSLFTVRFYYAHFLTFLDTKIGNMTLRRFLRSLYIKQEEDKMKQASLLKIISTAQLEQDLQKSAGDL
jgi:hypothetical protein